MVDLVRPGAYLHQLQALLPRGRAWPRGLRALLTALIDAVAQGKARLDLRAAALLLESRPSTATALLPEWERNLGLPDECSSLAPTIAGRRAAVLHKYAGQPDLSAASFRAIARSFGVDIEIRELDEPAAALATGLDTTGGRWRFVWWITIPSTADIRRFTALSRANERLTTIARDTELECRLQKAAPAHTLLIIGYDARPVLPTLPARAGTQGVALTETLPAASGGNPPLTYSATGLPAGLAFDPASREVDGTPTAAGTARVTYAVDDADGDRDSGMFDWAIAAPANQAPRADAGADQSVAAGARVTLDGSASDDADGTIVSYAWRQTAGDDVMLEDAATVTPEFDAPSTAAAQTLTFRLTTTDDDGAESFDDVSVAVAALANQAPRADAGADQDVAAGARVTLDGSASDDPDGTIASYAWAQTAGDDVMLSDAAVARPTFDLPRDTATQDLTFRLTVTDDEGATATDDVTVSVSALAGVIKRALPAHTEPGNNRIRWDDLANGLADVAALLAVAGTGDLVRMQFRGDRGDDVNRAIFRVAEEANGSDGGLEGPEMSAVWEGHGAAITLRVPGLSDLVLAGPDNPNVASRDASEPYGWVPGDDYAGGAVSYSATGGTAAGLSQWVTDFKAAYAADGTIRATLILDDGQ